MYITRYINGIMALQQSKLKFDIEEKSKYKKDFPTEEDSMFRNKRALNSSKKKKHFKNKKLK